MKIAKPVITLDLFVGRKSCCMTERKKSFDENHAPYVRPKRNSRHLPDSWDTKWIRVKQFRNWKRRCKKKHQWVKHKQTIEEIKRVTGLYPKNHITHIYSRDKWVKIQYRHRDEVEMLIESGELKPGYIKHKYWVYKDYRASDYTRVLKTVKRLEFVRRATKDEN